MLVKNEEAYGFTPEPSVMDRIADYYNNQLSKLTKLGNNDEFEHVKQPVHKDTINADTHHKRMQGSICKRTGYANYPQIR